MTKNNKKNKRYRFLWIGIIPVVLLISLLIFVYQELIQEYDLQQVDSSFPWVEKLKDMDVDLFGYNHIRLTEREVNQLALPILEQELEQQVLPAGLEVKEMYLQCTEQGIRVLANIQVGKLNTGVSAIVKFQVDDEKMTIVFDDCYIGTVAIPKPVVNLVIPEKEMVIHHGYLDLVEFDQIDYTNEGIELLVKLELDNIVRQFVAIPKQEGITEVLHILGKSQQGVKFANQILDMLLLNSLGVDITLKEILSSITNFTDISLHDKMRLVLAINKLI